MGFYEKIDDCFNKTSEALYNARTKFGEKQAIRKKQEYISDVKWTEEQNKQFDEYWIKNYGEIIPKDWHKMYHKMSGVFRVDYFPEYLFSTLLEPALNQKNYCKVFADKSLLYSLYSDIDKVHCPKAYVINSFGRFYDGSFLPITKENAVDILSDAGIVLFKSTIDSSGGKSIQIADFKDGKDVRRNLTVSEFFENYSSNFIVQEKIVPSSELQQIYPNALNTFRVITYLTADHIGHCPIAMRMGVGGMEVDNITSGGLCVGVCDDGRLKEFASNTRYGNGFNKKYSEHPDTKTVFKNVVIPQIPDMISVAEKMHRKTPQIGMISWDLSVDVNGEIVLIEANFYEQSSWFPQIINGESLFGDDTAYMLNLIRKNKK